MSLRVLGQKRKLAQRDREMIEIGPNLQEVFGALIGVAVLVVVAWFFKDRE